MSETTTYTPPEANPDSHGAEEQADFEILDHEKAIGSYDSQEAFLEDYMVRTARLIEMAQEFEAVDGEPVPADAIVFLDKSARPVYWMMDQMWPLVATPDADGTIPDKPAIKFANIDRLPWRIDPHEEITTNPENMRAPSASDLEGFRAIYDVPGQESLDGKRILIVDEVSDSGDTQYVARRLFSDAYPNATVRTMAWMDRSTLGARGEKIVQDVPIWYSASDEMGRGVLGPVTAESENANVGQRLTAESHQFMSTRPHLDREMSPEERERHDALVATVDDIEDPEEQQRAYAEIERLSSTTVDQKGLQLRAEIGEMVARFARLELTPAVYSQNILPQDEYEDTLIAQRRAREAAKEKTPLWR